MRYTAEQIKRHRAAETARNLAVVYVYRGAGTPSRHLNLVTGEFVESTPEMADACQNYPQCWNATISIILRERNGKIKVESRPIAARNEKKRIVPVVFEELTGVLDDYHKRLIRENKHPELLVNVGWIAVANKKDLSDDEVFEIYKKAGAWDDYIAPWEVELMKANGHEIEVLS